MVVRRACGAPGRIPRAAARTECRSTGSGESASLTSGEREVSIAKAGDLDVDPWQVARALRALAADPRLRPRLATDAGLALITEQPGQR